MKTPEIEQMRLMLLASLALALGSPALAQTSATTPASPPVEAPTDWGQALREDAQAFHDLVAANHPGPIDAENPGFNALLEDGLQLALRRAETADSYLHWRYALTEYANSFDDGHLGISRVELMGHTVPRRWPGFLTGIRMAGAEERHEVVVSTGPDAPPVGAVLVGCDNRSAQALAQEVLGRRIGRWALRSRRMDQSVSLFVDVGDPYARRPEVCEFRVDGQTRSFPLAWTDLTEAERDMAFAAGRSPRYTTPIELRSWSGGAWLGLGAFDSDPTNANAIKLAALVEEVERRKDEVRAAPIVVFDLRGNNGGSSSWITRMARILWGDDEWNAKRPRSHGVDWRVSDGNIAYMEQSKTTYANAPASLAWATSGYDGLTGARAQGQAFWRQGGYTPPPPAPETSLMTGRAYVFTDNNCASACLDAVDLLTALGATVVGQETAADTLYMEVRGQPVASRRLLAFVPLKVYRGRARGSNETVVPAHPWTGQLSDTAAIEAWLAGIDAAR